MNHDAGSPFESIESAREFVTLLAEAVAQAKQDVEADVQRESSSQSPRRLDALRTALYSMEKLELHMNQSRRILNDLRSLRRLLFQERAAKPKLLPNAQSTNHEARGITARRTIRDSHQRTASSVPQAD
jgi:hypothetical protein